MTISFQKELFSNNLSRHPNLSILYFKHKLDKDNTQQKNDWLKTIDSSK